MSQEKKQGDAQEPAFDSRLIPAMREAVLTVQMVLYRNLKKSVARRYPDWPGERHGLLTGAVVNNLFGSEPLDPGVTGFARENRELVEAELRGLADQCSELIPFLTDALRMQTICDNQEGIHSLGCLLMARPLGLLDEERTLPLPSTFMISVRNLAAVHGLVEPMQAAPPPDEPAD